MVNFFGRTFGTVLNRGPGIPSRRRNTAPTTEEEDILPFATIQRRRSSFLFSPQLPPLRIPRIPWRVSVALRIGGRRPSPSFRRWPRSHHFSWSFSRPSFAAIRANFPSSVQGRRRCDDAAFAVQSTHSSLRLLGEMVPTASTPPISVPFAEIAAVTVSRVIDEG